MSCVLTIGVSLSGCAYPREAASGANSVTVADGDELRALLEECRRQHASHVSPESLAGLKRDAGDARRFAEQQRRHREGMQRAMDTYNRGVCLIHGAFTMKEERDGRLQPVEDADGEPLDFEYLGSGFLVSDRGWVLTNRHVAEPWWNNDAIAPLIARGLVPKFTRLTATFPGRTPTDVDPGTVRTSHDGVDLAVFVVTIDAVHALPLSEGNARDLRGQGVMLLGYPTGLSALLARAEPEVAEEAITAAMDTASLIRELSARNGIAPLATHGTLNDVTDGKLIYDAVTTSGGSGGPVFGPDGTVIGVNFAMMRGFQGSNFGVPIRFARPLLDRLTEE
ncbi:MAG: trypsin-like peptidase domain-containing protein [Planctomycetes bacterium]|nr:trypsin-like peptidase domain-containing protein [Planctomycetota bacterium]